MVGSEKNGDEGSWEVLHVPAYAIMLNACRISLGDRHTSYTMEESLALCRFVFFSEAAMAQTFPRTARTTIGVFPLSQRTSQHVEGLAMSIDASMTELLTERWVTKRKTPEKVFPLESRRGCNMGDLLYTCEDEDPGGRPQ